MWMLTTWSASVIGLSTETVNGTVLPFSTIDGNSSLTLPRCGSVSPTSARMASSIVACVASAGSAKGENAALAVASTIQRRVGCITVRRPRSVRQRQQEGYHILDLLGPQDRLAAPRIADPGQPGHPVVRGHDRVRVEARRVDQAKPELAFGPTRTGPR